MFWDFVLFLFWGVGFVSVLCFFVCFVVVVVLGFFSFFFLSTSNVYTVGISETCRQSCS